MPVAFICAVAAGYHVQVKGSECDLVAFLKFTLTVTGNSVK